MKREGSIFVRGIGRLDRTDVAQVQFLHKPVLEVWLACGVPEFMADFNTRFGRESRNPKMTAIVVASL
ncbi:hypothetical protein ABID19_006715 [Mesorhizobium robiniae]|uniref:Transposase n=1 Tax=Mesorhizobium robiniae TaxID=559315 RepID=A0ABV2GZD9_9HYPH